MNLAHYRKQLALLGLASFLLYAKPLAAAPFELIYQGVFNTSNALNLASGPTTSFAAPTPFTLTAWFDTASQNYAPPSPPAPPPFAGFRAFAPTQALIEIAGVTYSIDSILTNPTAGMTVAIFDQNTFTPGRYGVGILQQPPQDGAGFVADFTTATPGFTANNIVPTVFSGYAGVGYSSGVCLQGTGGNCALAAVTPFVLRSGGLTYSLTLGNFEEQYPAAEPGSGDLTGPLNSVQLIATPEPSAAALFGLGLSAVLVLRRRLSQTKA